MNSRHTSCLTDSGCDVCFFFSSRRRHTRCLSDWSSDVCSSDLLYRQCSHTRHFLIPLGCSPQTSPKLTSGRRCKSRELKHNFRLARHSDRIAIGGTTFRIPTNHSIRCVPVLDGQFLAGGEVVSFLSQAGLCGCAHQESVCCVCGSVASGEDVNYCFRVPVQLRMTSCGFDWPPPSTFRAGKRSPGASGPSAANSFKD